MDALNDFSIENKKKVLNDNSTIPKKGGDVVLNSTKQKQYDNAVANQDWVTALNLNVKEVN